MGYQDNLVIAHKARARLDREPPNPFSKYTRHISRAQRINLPRHLESERDRVRIALISLPAFEPGQVQLKSFQLFNATTRTGKPDPDGTRRLIAYPPKVARFLSDQYQSALTQAIEHRQANIVCVNELGLPSTLRQRPKEDVLRHAHALAVDRDCVIIAGSSHDRRSFYNTTRIFYQGVDPGGVLYHKQVSATSSSVGEFVSVPPDRRTLLFRAFGLNVAVLTCLDMLDFASVAAVVKLSERVDLLLVPCYSEKTEALEVAARFASAAMPGIVILVNSRPRDNRHPCHVVKFGQPEVRENFGPGETVKSESLLCTYDIDRKSFRELKDDLKKQPTDQFEWLFGARDLEAR